MQASEDDPGPSYPSLLIVRAEVDLQAGEQERRGSDADSRAALVVAFAGVVIGLGQDVRNVVQVLGLVLACVAAVSAVVALWPSVNGSVDLDRLHRAYLQEEERRTARMLLDTHVQLFQENRARLHQKTAWVKFSVVALGCSIGLTLTGAIVGYLA